MRNDLKEARIARKLTQAQLADLVGKDQAAISRIESGALAVDLDTAPLLAKALKLDIVAVLYGPAGPRARAAA